MNPLQIAQLLTVVLCLAPSVSARWHLPVATAPLNQDGDEHALYRGRLIEEGTRPTLGIVSMVKVCGELNAQTRLLLPPCCNPMVQTTG